MSNSTPPPEPNPSPAYFGESDVFEATMVPRRPGGLTAICVIAIILGVLGAMMGLMGLVGAVAGQAMQNAFTPSLPDDMDDEALKVQIEMNQAMQQVGQRFIGPNVVLIVFSLTLATGLIVGGAQSLKIKPAGRTILLAVFTAAILFELIRGSFQVYVQMQVMAVVAEYWPRLMESAGAQQHSGGPNMETFLTIVLTAAKAMAYAATVVPVLVKGGFYAVGALYLGRQKVKRLFEQSAESQTPFGSAKPTI